MGLFTVDDAYAAADRASTLKGRAFDSAINEDRKIASGRIKFDVFLSHSSSDKRFVFGARRLLEEQGLTAYVDWIDDPQLDRTQVSTATASTIRTRLKQSDSLLYATSTNSSSSKWMPWEIGYFDGLRGDRIAIFPLLRTASATFVGQEYLGLYPYIEKISDFSERTTRLGMAKTANMYVPLLSFVKGKAELRTGSR